MPTTGTTSDSTASPLLASSGLGATLGQAIAYAMLRVGNMPFSSAQILAGAWDGTSLTGTLAMLDEAVDSGRWGETEIRAFLDTLDLKDFITGSTDRLAALNDGLTLDPFLSALSQAGLTTEFFLGSRIAPAALDAAAAALTGILRLPENHAPEATGLAPASLTLAEGSGLTLHLADYFLDPDGDDLGFSVSTPIGGVPFHLTVDGDLVLSPGFASSGFHGLLLTASDGQTTTSLVLDLNVTEAGAATRLTSMDFSKVQGQAENVEEALAVTAKSRGIDILDQTALGDGQHVIAVDNLALRAGAGISGNFVLADSARVLTLRGQGEFTVSGNGGANVFYGGTGNETMLGGAANDQLFGEGGDDHLFGGADADKLWGGTGSDRLLGDAGDDQLYGGDGADYLRGGSGRDQAWGGAGADVFDFHQGDGTYILRDMTLGEDLIRMEGFAGIDSFGDLLAQALWKDVDGLLRISIGTEQLHIQGMTGAQLTAEMFLFA